MFDAGQSGRVLSEPFGSPDEYTTSSSASSQTVSGPSPREVRFRVIRGPSAKSSQIGGSALPINEPTNSRLTYPVLIDAPGLPSPSVLEAIRQAAELLQLPRGWNSYDAAPVSRESFKDALTFLLEADTAIPDLAPPAVVPTAPGGIQLEWHQGGVDIEVEFSPGEPSSWYAEDVESGKTAEEVLASKNTTLHAWLARASD